MSVLSLGYMGVRAKKLEDWTSYGPRHLGLQRVDKSRSSVAFRMDDRSQRIVVNEANDDGVDFLGWEVADKRALDALGARLEQGKIRVTRGSRALADERKVADLVTFQDPSGNRLEAFHNAEISGEAFRPGSEPREAWINPVGGHMGRTASTWPSADEIEKAASQSGLNSSA